MNIDGSDGLPAQPVRPLLPCKSAVQAQLKRVLNSRQFQSSELQQLFLSFVVEKTLNGSGDEIKEYVIGAEAFGRGESFDPRLDSVVRVVARRVRDRLAEYYRTDGRDDPVVVRLEKGSYVPLFELRGATAGATVVEPDGMHPAGEIIPSSESASVSEEAPRRIGAKYWVGVSLIAVIAIGLVVYFLLLLRMPLRILRYTQLTDDGQGKLGAFAVGTPAPLVTDGARVYFTEVSGSDVVLSQVSTAGGQTVPLRRDLKEPLVVMDISPDKAELLATRFFRESPDGQLQILPLPDGMPRPVGSLVGHDGTSSPDGERICYASGNLLYVARSDGTDSKVLAILP